MTNQEHMYSKVRKALDIGGNTHTLQDVLGEIARGDKQSFAINNTWAITQIEDYPQKRVLAVFMVVGDMKDVDAVYQQVLGFADRVGATVVRAFGRPGWKKKAASLGWRKTTELYVKELP